jgi:hypothetical protein
MLVSKRAHLIMRTTVIHYAIDLSDYNARLDEICKERNYTYRDEVLMQEIDGV